MLAIGPGTAGAAAFQLLEQGAQGQGTSFAGTATRWTDPATAFWNPAGMARHTERSVTLGGSVIDVSFDFSDDGSTLNAGGMGNLTYDQIPGAEAETDTDAGETAVAPSFYYIQPWSNDLTFGFAINAPFGLESNYDPEWVGRYHAIHSELTTINLNPSLAYRLNDQVSVGAGVNLQYAEATLTRRVDPNAAGAPFGQTFGSTRGDPDDDSDVEIEGDNWGAGINLGVLADITERTRFGISYRGHVTQSVDADASYRHRNAQFETFAEANDIFVDADAAATLDLPETLTISLARDLSRLPDVRIMSDLTWTRWSRLQALEIEYDSEQPDTEETLAFRDTTRFALGATWDVSPAWQLRTGLAYDESPVADRTTRSPRIPDNNRRWASLGIGYHPPGSDFEVDVGYSRLSISDTRIERANEAGDVLRGDYDSAVDILAVQGSLRF